ncbi:MAG: T9SS type A sorting domain-containing protein, partial [Bacteroidota bacterium]
DKWYWTISGTSGIDSTTKYKNYIGIPNGTYTVCLKVKNSCGVDSTCQQLNYVYYPINVQENSKNIISNVYPNPFRDKLIISCERINANTNPIQIKVMNSLGLLVYSDKMEGTQKEIQLPELASGLYFIQFTLNEIVVIRKLIKE